MNKNLGVVVYDRRVKMSLQEKLEEKIIQKWHQELRQ